MSDFRITTIADAHAAFRAGTLTARSLAERCLANIEKHEPVIRAWVALNVDAALAEADRADEAFARGEWLGPLHGIPIGVKDIVDVRGFPTRSGSVVTSPEPVDEDAPIIARLRAAGAVILGKTVTTEFACFEPAETRNPWNTSHTPGGSSSGSAAALAAGMCVATIGSQTGGSIIRPAAYCGVFGLKPTLGAAPTDRVAPVSGWLDVVGPLANSAFDLWQVFAVMAGNEYVQPIGRATKPYRIAVLHDYFVERSTADLLAVYTPVVDEFRAAGAEVHAIEAPAGLLHSRTALRRIMAYDAWRVHERDFKKKPEAFSGDLASLLRAGQAIGDEEMARALESREEFREELKAIYRDCDLIVTPSTPSTAPSVDTTGDPRFNVPWSVAGNPAINIPIGFASDGLPVGLQAASVEGSERMLCEFGEWTSELLRKNP